MKWVLVVLVFSSDGVAKESRVPGWSDIRQAGAIVQGRIEAVS
jgi:hypothetical protein